MVDYCELPVQINAEDDYDGDCDTNYDDHEYDDYDYNYYDHYDDYDQFHDYELANYCYKVDDDEEDDKKEVERLRNELKKQLSMIDEICFYEEDEDNYDYE